MNMEDRLESAIGKDFLNLTSYPYDYKHNIIQDDGAFNTSTQSNQLFAIHTKYISGNDCCKIIYFLYPIIHSKC
jgi:hypothetical protein